MVVKVYTIKDKLARECGPPFTAVNDEVAKRQFKQMGIPKDLLDEYELLQIGYFDTIEAELTPELKYFVVDMEVKDDTAL